MYDEIERSMAEQGVLDELRRAKNDEGHTPLKLAAAVGSLAMFNHLFDKEVEVAWIFGPVVCRKLYLKGIDVPLRRAAPPGRALGSRLARFSEFRLRAAGKGKGAAQGVAEVEDEGDERSVLEVSSIQGCIRSVMALVG